MNLEVLEAPVPVIQDAITESSLSAGSDMIQIAALAYGALICEVHTWRTPGLVSHVDSGSHRDMDYDMFEASADSLLPYFRGIAQAGAGAASMYGLRMLGIEAECAMLQATGGVNTHR